jgi:hypothetical protein
MNGDKLRPTGPAIRVPEPSPALKSIAIQPDEFLFPGSSVVVETTRPMDAELAQQSIGVAREDNAVKVASTGRTATWTPPEDLTPGAHLLQVGPLVSTDGDQLNQGFAVPFTFVDSGARIPKQVAIESFARLRVTAGGLERVPLGTPTRGKYVELMKGVDRKSGTPVSLAFDESGKRVDELRLLRKFEKARAAKTGKLNADLRRRIRSAKPDEWLNVAIWSEAGDEVRPDDKRGLERVTETPGEPAAAKRRLEALKARTSAVAKIAEEAGAREVQVDEATPVVFARVQKRTISKLTARREVAAVFLYEPEGIEDLKDSIAVANSDDVHTAGAKGAGVKVAVWEDGPTSTADLVIEARYDSSPSTSDHSQHVHGIIRNKEANKPHGHAPDCKLHSANSKSLSALRWAVKDKLCTVVNQSFHRPSEPKSDELSFDDVYKDWLVLNWPYPTIVQAAGNFWEDDPDDIDPPNSEYVNHKGFNSIAIANHDDTASAMSSSSVFRNPDSQHGDRELPELSANGTGVETVGFTKSGTSMASPAAAGVAALLQSTDATLKAWPEGCRAIMLAGATRNVVADTWWQDVADDEDASDGSGAVNARESHAIAKSRQGRNNRPSLRGWDVGTLASGDFGSNGLSKFAYRIQVPRRWFGPRHVKVGLAWDSKVSTLSILGITLPLSSRLTVDLDLKVFDKNGALVGYSGSWDNSYEIAEFDAVPGETYDVRLRRWSGTDWTWFGLAWTVTGSLLDLGTIIGAGPGRLAAATESLNEAANGGAGE